MPGAGKIPVQITTQGMRQAISEVGALTQKTTEYQQKQKQGIELTKQQTQAYKELLEQIGKQTNIIQTQAQVVSKALTPKQFKTFKAEFSPEELGMMYPAEPAGPKPEGKGIWGKYLGAYRGLVSKFPQASYIMRYAGAGYLAYRGISYGIGAAREVGTYETEAQRILGQAGSGGMVKSMKADIDAFAKSSEDAVKQIDRLKNAITVMQTARMPYQRAFLEMKGMEEWARSQGLRAEAFGEVIGPLSSVAAGGANWRTAARMIGGYQENRGPAFPQMMEMLGQMLQGQRTQGFWTTMPKGGTEAFAGMLGWLGNIFKGSPQTAMAGLGDIQGMLQGGGGERQRAFLFRTLASQPGTRGMNILDWMRIQERGLAGIQGFSGMEYLQNVMGQVRREAGPQKLNQTLMLGSLLGNYNLAKELMDKDIMKMSGKELDDIMKKYDPNAVLIALRDTSVAKLDEIAKALNAMKLYIGRPLFELAVTVIGFANKWLPKFMSPSSEERKQAEYKLFSGMMYQQFGAKPLYDYPLEYFQKGSPEGKTLSLTKDEAALYAEHGDFNLKTTFSSLKPETRKKIEEALGGMPYQMEPAYTEKLLYEVGLSKELKDNTDATKELTKTMKAKTQKEQIPNNLADSAP